MWFSSSLLFLAALSTTEISHAFLAPVVAASATNRCLTASGLRAAGAKDTPETLPDFETAQDYLEYLESVSALPKGFATGTADGTFVSVEAPSLGDLKIRGTVIHVTNGPTDNWAACFTSNKFPGSPVKVGRKRMAAGGPIQAIVINNKVSNVCSGGDGEGDSERVCAAVAKGLDLPSADYVIPCSTGVIGWRLPAKELAEDIVPLAINNLQSDSVLNAARSIMTTDRFPKVRSITLSNGARLVGIAKGAGMIEPNMATMLSYFMTDATVPKEDLQRILSKTVDETFNCLSIDGDESTSDSVITIASNMVTEPVDLKEFEEAMLFVGKGLAADIVRNGEGTSHVMRVQIEKFPGTKRQARFLGRHIVNSPLFKCAVSGNDPNTGRLAAAIGSFMGKYMPDTDLSGMSLTLGGRCIFKNGKFVLEGDEVEKALSQHMKDAEYGDSTVFPPHQRFVELGVDFGSVGGDVSLTILGSDLTQEYVVVNADYRS